MDSFGTRHVDEHDQNESLWSRGLRLERQGDVAGAIAAYGLAADSGEEPREARAILRYAEILEARGLHGPAEEAFIQASGSNENDVKAGAWRGVAAGLMMRGEVDAALAALERVVETRDPVESPRALRNIGTIREDSLGDPAGARQAYEAAIAYDHPLHSQGARVNLAQLLDRQGERVAAAELLQDVIASRHPVEAGRASALLGWMLEEQGDDSRALECFETAMADGNQEWRARAAMGAGGIYYSRGELGRASAAFSLAEGIPDRAGKAGSGQCTGAGRRRADGAPRTPARLIAQRSPRERRRLARCLPALHTRG